jgi:hypothetical protein
MPKLNDVIIAVDGVSTQEPIPTEVKSNCMCKYPAVAYRNGSGHAEHCPIHIAYCKARGILTISEIITKRVKAGQF